MDVHSACPVALPTLADARPLARVALLSLLLSTASSLAATPGLPFTEDFSDSTLKDHALTNANWSTEEQALVLAWRDRRFGSFEEVSGVNVSDDSQPTFAIALGDVDGDGDLDLVAGNVGLPNRLYLNNGTDDPWNGVLGSVIGSDADSTFAIALADMDRDGDLDLIAGNGDGGVNRLYLNNGTADPWGDGDGGVAVVGSDITGNAHDSRALAVGDVDGDGNLDVIVGNLNAVNRIYLNDGTASLWTASDIGTESNATRTLALADVDSDGDLDLVVRNQLQTNRLYLNNGSTDPWSGATGGVAIGSDADDTRSLALGDMNGDNHLDLAVGNVGINKLYLSNRTDNPWSSVVTGSAIGSEPDSTRYLVLGDIDGDGDLDVLAGNLGAANRLYRNTGSPQPFDGVSGSDISAAAATHALALDDVNGDGKIDLIAGNDGSNRAYFNQGTRSPWSGVIATNPTGAATDLRALVIGDVDGNGYLDLVAGIHDAENLLYLNDGSGTFGGGISISSDIDLTHALVLGDVDNDGDLDLIAGNWSQTNRLYLNNGTNTPFNGVIGSDISGDVFDTEELVLGDVDGDGDLDLISGERDAPSRLYLNNGTANPFNGVTGSDIGSIVNDTRAVALGDVDGDGDVDLIEGNAAPFASRVYLNNGTTTPFSSVDSYLFSDGDTLDALALGDLDGDGDLDLVAGKAGISGAGQINRLFRNDGGASPFGSGNGSQIGSDAHATKALYLGDVDADGDLDLIDGNDGGTNRLYLNNGGADPFSGVTGISIGTATRSTQALAVGDMDRDGDLDLVTGNSDVGNLLYRNNGQAKTVGGIIGINVSGDGQTTFALVIGDVDGDGDLDLIAGNWNQTNRLYLNNGTNTPFAGVSGRNISTDRQFTSALALGDVDGDGDLDLIAGSGNSINPETSRLYLNNGTSDPWGDGDGGVAVVGSNITADSFTTQALALADVDGDGDLDLIAGNEGTANRRYLNTGAGSFGAGSNVTADAHDTHAVVLGDVDGDGDLDLIAGNFGQTNRLYLNNSAGAFGNSSNISADVRFTRALALGDMDGDGDLDLITGESSTANRLYLNDGSGGFGAGSDFSDDRRFTRVLALGDMDGDGDLDLAEGSSNFQTNRLYQRRLFHTARGDAVSLRVDAVAENNILGVSLSADTMMPPNTSVDFWLSNNGGQQWFRVYPDQPFVFPSIGADLRWKVELDSGSPALTPLVDTVSINRDRLDQTIAFAANPGPLIFNGAGGSVSAIASSGLAVSYASESLTVCDVDANSGALSIVGTGICVITADQAGDGNYNPAQQETEQVVIERANQAITFGRNPGPLALGASALVTATASSELAVSFASLTPIRCSVDALSGAVTTLSVGDCVISANQAGDSNYRPAAQVTQTVLIEIDGEEIFADGFEV